MNWYIDGLKKYAVFEGRAHRTAYWMFFLISVIAVAVLGVADNVLGTVTSSGAGGLSSIYSLATLLPGLGLGVRRLHDTGRSGWWLLIALVPIVGAIVLLIYFVQDSQPGANAYGPNPWAA